MVASTGAGVPIVVSLALSPSLLGVTGLSDRVGPIQGGIGRGSEAEFERNATLAPDVGEFLAAASRTGDPSGEFGVSAEVSLSAP